MSETMSASVSVGMSVSATIVLHLSGQINVVALAR